MTDAGTIGLWPLRLGITRVDVRWRLAAAIAVELLYMVLSRAIYYAGLPSYADVEIWRTPLRLGTAMVLWLLMADVIFEGRLPGSRLGKGTLWAAFAILFVTPLLVETYSAPARDALTIALASFPVGLHEEFFFRGIAQVVLIKRLGPLRGICVATAVFATFHIGVTEWSALNFIDIALAGAILGLIYFQTGSMITVVLAHAIHDVMYCVTWAAPLPAEFGVFFSLMGVIVVLPRRTE